MDFTFIIIAALTLGSAIAAMSLRNLVHCALCMVVAFGGIALTYLKLNAEFVGLAQLLVYVGAVAILIVFAVLLTRSDDARREVRFAANSILVGFGVVALVAVTLLVAIQKTKILPVQSPVTPQAPVKQIGEQIMTTYVLPLEVIGLLLTAAMIGAVVVSMKEKETGQGDGIENTKVPPSRSIRPEMKREIAVLTKS